MLYSIDCAATSRQGPLQSASCDILSEPKTINCASLNVPKDLLRDLCTGSKCHSVLYKRAQQKKIKSLTGRYLCYYFRWPCIVLKVALHSFQLCTCENRSRKKGADLEAHNADVYRLFSACDTTVQRGMNQTERRILDKQFSNLMTLFYPRMMGLKMS